MTGTLTKEDRLLRMDEKRPLWLVNNAASGSNDEAALQALEECCGGAGLHVAHRTAFPDQDLPTPDMLDSAGVDLVAVFAGDGTINSLIETLAGWGGAVLVLPGGTMNLLYHRLHGDASMEDAIAAVAAGRSRRLRPGIVRSPAGDALAGMLAGPGTSWNHVREAMREQNLVEMAGSTAEAIEETLGGAMIACREPALGRAEGYPLINLEPHDHGIGITVYHAENAGEYLGQAWALLRRNFREGPHEQLGTVDRVVLASTDGQPFGLLIDGEPAEVGAEAEFLLAAADVDLLATAPDGR